MRQINKVRAMKSENDHMMKANPYGYFRDIVGKKVREMRHIDSMNRSGKTPHNSNMVEQLRNRLHADLLGQPHESNVVGDGAFLEMVTRMGYTLEAIMTATDDHAVQEMYPDYALEVHFGAKRGDMTSVDILDNVYDAVGSMTRFEYRGFMLHVMNMDPESVPVKAMERQVFGAPNIALRGALMYSAAAGVLAPGQKAKRD